MVGGRCFAFLLRPIYLCMHTVLQQFPSFHSKLYTYTLFSLLLYDQSQQARYESSFCSVSFGPSLLFLLHSGSCSFPFGPSLLFLLHSGSCSLLLSSFSDSSSELVGCSLGILSHRLLHCCHYIVNLSLVLLYLFQNFFVHQKNRR